MSLPNGDKFDREDLDDNEVLLTVRVLMQGKEVGSIIGKKGDLVRQLREESGSKIHISDGSSVDRIVTVTGNLDSIFKAFSLITLKVKEFFERQSDNWGTPVAPLTFKLIVPASQCGSIIGKGGSKIKDLKEATGAAIQVSSDMLPNSTERTVIISGTPDTITQCIYQVCLILMESPPRGTVIPYRPKPNSAGNVFLGGGNLGLQGLGDLGRSNTLNSLAGLGIGGLGSLAGLGGGGLNAAALAAVAASQLRGGNKKATQSTTQEMTVPNEFIGCIIGKGGSKIIEIRQISGAMIRIANNDDTREGPDGLERPITITGTPDAITIAKYLINMRYFTVLLFPSNCPNNSVLNSLSQVTYIRPYYLILSHLSVDLQKANLEAQNQSNSSGSPPASSTPSPLSSALPIASLLSKPAALNALSAIGGLTDLLGTAAAASTLNRPVQTTGVHRNKQYGHGRVRSMAGDKSKSDRNKFAPY